VARNFEFGTTIVHNYYIVLYLKYYETFTIFIIFKFTVLNNFYIQVIIVTYILQTIINTDVFFPLKYMLKECQAHK